MAKVKTPVGETIEVKRRWFPWPNFARAEKLEELGLPANFARNLGKNHGGDWLLTGALVILGLLLSQISPIVGLVILALTIVGLTVWFFALPWVIEIFHEGRLIDAEECDGFSLARARMEKLAALYESGALKPPAQVKPSPPQSTLVIEPKPIKHRPKKETPMKMPRLLPTKTSKPEELEDLNEAHLNLPDTPESSFGSPRQADFDALLSSDAELEEVEELEEAGAFMISHAPLLDSGEPVARVDAGPAVAGESILRKAIRQVDAENQALKDAGLKVDDVDPAVLKQAMVRKRSRFLR